MGKVHVKSLVNTLRDSTRDQSPQQLSKVAVQARTQLNHKSWLVKSTAAKYITSLHERTAIFHYL